MIKKSKPAIFSYIKTLKIQGATSIAIESLKYLEKFSKKNGFGKRFDKECEKLLKVRPTAVVLYNVIKDLKKDKSEKKIGEILDNLKNVGYEIGKNGAHLIKKRYQVHTHCHSSHALAVIKEAAKEGKKFRVIADITRPKLQGLKTVKELAKFKNIKVTLIPDNALGLALTDPVLPIDDIVIVGSDSIRKEGVVNKIGTYLLALAAREQKVPFYVAASVLKVDKRKKFVIEERNPLEIHKKIKNVTIRNPAFDVTPLKFITGGFITEAGVFTMKKFKEVFLK